MQERHGCRDLAVRLQLMALEHNDGTSSMASTSCDQAAKREAVRVTGLLIEPFYGGSHKQLVDLLAKEIPSCKLHCLPAKKWHWRMRTSALYFAQNIPFGTSYKVLFASSVLNLAELVALRPDLAQLKKVLYFHENQLIYPVRKQQDRDFQYGYNQILSCLVADDVVFNSHFNMESFLSSINGFLKLMPDFRPKGLEQKIRPKCQVVYFPLNETDYLSSIPGKDGIILNSKIPFKQIPEETEANSNKKLNIEVSQPLYIVWAHRWEHDKGPDLFFHTLYQLADQGLQFKVSVLGERFSEVPAPEFLNPSGIDGYCNLIIQGARVSFCRHLILPKLQLEAYTNELFFPSDSLSIFEEAFTRLRDHIVHWGYQESRQDYIAILRASDVAVSTAQHEFFGVSMLEAVQHGCYPLCPNKLVYPEIFPSEYLYSTTQQLSKKLRYFCKNPRHVRTHKITVDWRRFTWDTLKDSFYELLSSTLEANKT